MAETIDPQFATEGPRVNGALLGKYVGGHVTLICKVTSPNMVMTTDGQQVQIVLCDVAAPNAVTNVRHLAPLGDDIAHDVWNEVIKAVHAYNPAKENGQFVDTDLFTKAD